MISISADEASEDEQPEILHFRGHFRMRSDDWQLTSDAATVYGRPDKPERVLLEGSPAYFTVNRTDRTDMGRITASASVVEYLRDPNLLVLSGGATLMLGDEIIHSKHIEYDIGTNRYQAGGADGVLIEVPPVD
jgi:lipopolysaccharide transport protein LptA